MRTYGKRLNRALKNSTLYQNLKNNDLEFNDNSYAEILNCFYNVRNEIIGRDKKKRRE